jgi:hypothetical protein
MKKTKKRGKTERNKFLDRLKKTNYVSSAKDQRFLFKCLGLELAFFLVGIVGIFNLTVFGIAMVAKKPYALMQTFIEIQKTKGGEAALEALRALQPERTMLTGIVLAIIIAIIGYVVFMLALSFFKGLIYSNLTGTKMNKQYILKFFLFNIAYYLIISILLFIFFKIFQLPIAIKIFFAIIILYLYFTPFFRMYFNSKKIFAGMKTALKNALELSIFLRILLILITFGILASILMLIIPPIVLAFFSILIFYYVSAWSRLYLYKTTRAKK